ncbi:MAG: DUF1499 domain-containing protein [Chlamydiales bacterium]|nr:DUF1499 domain-containing protein [Chlamydiales bacterium]NCF70586.1 DUF1499 domain-containing protein [Chlamydiales bacterium]
MLTYLKFGSLLALLIILYGAYSANQQIHRSVSVDKKSLSPCPETPNCVSSLAPTNSSHYIVPFKNSAPDSLKIIKETMLAHLSSRVLSEEPNYLHLESATPFFHFKDDVEFLILDDTIHVRSISRLGHYDFNANRKRVEKLRSLLPSFD